ncbi:hypothetical protein AVMA1855_03470 [Acidovorax sp. SUPP1855]|uniref:thioesterase domain-containing protein n=1 Tax=Acidovorax sp. SUPP1855 TaxID=431774 RepID=UPI0023DE667A|nr:thioesterase domain-containing protein [Acidovorax sp. SUPP1855]GKS83168.1 hypothetical protein AVMA1855_03470 [Acidovorax sp. SUPP1855]
MREPNRFVDKGNDAALIADLRDPVGTPEGAWKSAGLLRLTLDALAVAYRVCQSFRHTEPGALPVRWHVLAGRQDRIDPLSMQAWSAESSATRTRGWLDGGHFSSRPQESPFLAPFVCRLAQTTAGGARAAAALA